MILNYRSIGDLLIEKKGITVRTSIEFKRFILGHFCSDLDEYQKLDKNNNIHISYLLRLNLDTHQNKAEFSLAEQLYPAAAAEIMLYKKPAPNDPNIF